MNLDSHDDMLRLYNLPLLQKKAIQELHGVAAMIVYDGVVDDNEIGFLTEWLTRHAEFSDLWPLSELCDLLEAILADGKVDQDERLQLLTFLSGISASPEETGTAGDSIFHPEPDVVFTGCSFLFTGKLEMGTRKRAQKQVEDLGGVNLKSPRSDLNWLVVGDLGTDQWKFSRYGTKIEKVMTNKERGGSTLIVREVDFVRAVVALSR